MNKEENVEFGNLFNDEAYRGDIMLMRYALNELAEHLGHSFKNPLSLHLLCLELMIPFDVCWLMYKDIAWIVNSGSREEKEKLRDYQYVQKEIMCKHFPEAKEFNQLTIGAFMKALAKCYLPELLSYYN